MCLPRDVDTVSVCDFDPLFDSNLCLYYYYLNFLLNSSSINLVISKMIIFEKLINCWKCLLFSRESERMMWEVWVEIFKIIILIIGLDVM